ncbi:MAG: exosortase [Pyrinomonadaceae bacterium]
MSAINGRSLYQPFLISLALAFLYATVLSKLARDWWNDENYSHGLLIPFIIGYILWTQRERLAAFAARASFGWGAAMVLMGLVGLWGGTAGAELFVQRTSLVLMLAGIVVYFWGFKLLRLVSVPLALLFLAIPIPAIVLNKIAFPLQLLASRCAVSAIAAFNIPVLRQGNVIELMPLGATQPKRLEVVEACSGIRSLMTLITLAVVFAYFTHPRGDDAGPRDGGSGPGRRLKSFALWRSVLIVLSAIPIAILTNVLRVSGTGVLARFYGTKVADGFFHSFSGWVMYIAAFLMLFGVGWLIDRFSPDRKKVDKAARRRRSNSGSSGGHEIVVGSEPSLVKGTD